MHSTALLTMFDVFLTVNALSGYEMLIRYALMRADCYYVANGFGAQKSPNMHKNQRFAYVCRAVITRIPVYSWTFFVHLL